MRVTLAELERVLRPWTARHGYRLSVSHVDGEERAAVEIDRGGHRFSVEAFALDGFGNVAVDLARDPSGVRRAFTGPLPDLLAMLEEVRQAVEALPTPPPAGDLN